MFNLSLKSGTYPASWKKSLIHPIFKNKGDRRSVDNYRPIAMIHGIGKIFEHLANDKLTSFLNANEFFHDNQYGFREHRSIHHAIIHNLNFVSLNLNSGSKCNLILLDIKRAFDSTDRGILLSKLEKAGIRGFFLKWLSDYMSHREMFIRVNGVTSNSSFISDKGVLQGSALSSTLFALYVNDILNVINDKKHAKPHIIRILQSVKSKFCLVFYADDAALAVTHPSEEQLCHDTNILNDLIFRYYVANRICVHPDKTEFIHFIPSLNFREISVRFGSHLYPNSVKPIVSTNKYVRYLGYFFNFALDSSYFFETYISKLKKGLYYLQKNKDYLCVELKTLIYYSYVHSHLEFISLYFCAAPPLIRKKITQLHKKSIRLLCSLRFNSHTANFFELTGILPVEMLHTFNVIKFVSQSKETNLNNIFKQFWPFNYECGTRSSARFGKYIVVPRLRTAKLSHQPLFSFAKCFNEISNIFQTINEYHDIKEYLLVNNSINNKCLLPTKSCFSCTKHANDSPAIWRAREYKAHRVKTLIRSKGRERKARYQELISRHNLRNFDLQLMMEVN